MLCAIPRGGGIRETSLQSGWYLATIRAQQHVEPLVYRRHEKLCGNEERQKQRTVCCQAVMGGIPGFL